MTAKAARTYTVIIGHCTAFLDRLSPEHGGNYILNHRSGFTIREIFHHAEATADSLLRFAQHFAKDGVFVVVRPNFNDLRDAHDRVIGYREWRSFDGAPLQQVDFPTPGLMARRA